MSSFTTSSLSFISDVLPAVDKVDFSTSLLDKVATELILFTAIDSLDAILDRNSISTGVLSSEISSGFWFM